MSTLNDHGLEVIRKSGEEVTPGNKSDYYIKVGQVPGQAWDVNVGSVTVLGDAITSGTVDGTRTGTERTFVNNLKNQVLAAHDLAASYTWLDFGNKNERVSSIVYTSATFVGVTVTRTFTYSLVGTKYRLDLETWFTAPGG
jgi:hypothetical protein